MKIIECVPNFSEGRDYQKIKIIVKEIQSAPQVFILDLHSGKTTNRSVVTFIGTPEGVKEGAFRGIKKAVQILDMRTHQGTHMRLGVIDVCPLIPVLGVSMEKCVQLSHQLGKKVAQELGIPVYLYEQSAQFPERKNLANIRKGQWEGLEEKLKHPAWAPDYGKPVFNPKTGATVIGARKFLIALNINLNTKNKNIAHQIAIRLRESGRVQRDIRGKIIKDDQGNPIRIPGKFKAVKAIGWYVEEYKIAQISINFTDYKVSPPHLVFEEATQEAEKRGVKVTGCELIGLIPKQPLLMAGKYSLKKQRKNLQVPEKKLIQHGVKFLNLNDVTTFNPQKKIIEYQVKKYKKYFV